MLIHYLKIAFRNLRKHKTQSLTGIFGLAFVLACFVPALYWIRYETTYDNFYPDAARIYRIYSFEKLSGKINERVPGILEQKLHDHFPAIENSIGFALSYDNYSTVATPHIRLQTLYADSVFFSLFPQMFVSGDARQLSQNARNIILTEREAIRLFGNVESAIGQAMKSKSFTDAAPPFIVSAVVKDPPLNTNLPFNAIRYPLFQNQMTEYMPVEEQWRYFNKQMYVKLHPRTNVDELAGQLRDFTLRLKTNANIEIRMLPIGDIRHRLNADLPFTLDFIRLFVAAGFLLLFSAFFNFLNLHLDLFRQRISELRQRTVHGAKSWQLIVQMMFELICAIFPALLLACFLVVITAPLFSGLLGIAMGMSQLLRLFAVCGAGMMALMLLIGFIPFWRLSRLALHYLSKRKIQRQPVLRRMAVTVQLAVSIVFILSALVVMMQMRFVKQKDLGFEHRGVIRLSDHHWTQEKALMQALTTIPRIESITSTDFEPKHGASEITDVEWQGKSLYEKPAFQSIGTDSRFAETFRLKMIQGKWWNEGERKKAVLNEEAVRVMGLHDPIGAVIRIPPNLISSVGENPLQEVEVVGVVNDFHTLSLRSRIYPVIFSVGGGDPYIRVFPGQEHEAIRQIAAILPDIDASLVGVQLTPLDELYDRLNYSEQAGLKMFSVLATVCLLISLFGIYAVVVASTQRRRKEIAIRKVFGAEIGDIVRMFFREHTIQVILAAVVALPLAYHAMHRWLQGYAYRTNIPWWLLAGVLIAVIVVVLFTVLGQVLKAANSNPAEVVKSE